MYTCMYASMFIIAHIHACAYAYVHMHVCILFIITHIHAYACFSMSTITCIYICMCAYKHTYTHDLTRTFILFALSRRTFDSDSTRREPVDAVAERQQRQR